MSTPAKRPIGVFLADDDDDFRRAYRRLFERTDGFRLTGEAGDGRQASRLIVALRPDVAVIDVQMPGGSGLEITREVLTNNEQTRVVVLTTFDLDEYVAEALQLGASGFLLKNASPAEVLQAVRAVHAGHASLAPEVTARLINQSTPRQQSGRHAFADHVFTERELQVTRLVARGYSNRRIADELFLSHETVRTYLKRMFAKLAVNDRTQLAILAHEAGLLHESR